MGNSCRTPQNQGPTAILSKPELLCCPQQQWRFSQTNTQRTQVTSQTENTANKHQLRCLITRDQQVHAQRHITSNTQPQPQSQRHTQKHSLRRFIYPYAPHLLNMLSGLRTKIDTNHVINGVTSQCKQHPSGNGKRLYNLSPTTRFLHL